MRSISATYENGVFRPREQVTLPAGAEVEVILPDERDATEAAKERFPLSFGAIDRSDAEEMRRAIEEECERIEPNDE